MLRRALTAGLLGLTLGAGLFLTPGTADAQRWRRYLPFGGYFLDQATGMDQYWNDGRYYDGRYYDGRYYDPSYGWRYNDGYRPGDFYGGYFETHWDPYYGRYYYFDPYTGQSYWY